MNDSFSNHAVCLPAPALRPFISHYAGFPAKGLPPVTHAGLPSRHVDLIISLAGPIEVIGIVTSRARVIDPPGSYIGHCRLCASIWSRLARICTTRRFRKPTESRKATRGTGPEQRNAGFPMSFLRHR